MPEHLRALIVILIISVLVFVFGKKTATPIAITVDDYCRRRNLWFIVTLIAFLSASFWVFIFSTGALIIFSLKNENNCISLYFFLLLTVPMIEGRVMFPYSNLFLFDIHYGRLLSLVILLPALFSDFRNNPKRVKFGSHIQDKILLVYLVLHFVLYLTAYSIENTLRVYVFYSFMDIFLPYYVASRALENERDFRDSIMSLIVPATVLAAVAFQECARHWLLYKSLQSSLGIDWQYGNYLHRGGVLRAQGTTGQAIACGYVIAVAIGFSLYFRKSTYNSMIWYLGFGVLIAGLLAALSRGPWVGTVLMVMVFITTGPHAITNYAKLGILTLFLINIAALTPVWNRLIGFLPWVGDIDFRNIELREYLLTESIDIIMENPFFGSRQLNLEQFRTGEGIIDIVNTYLSIAFNTGLVGLSIYLLFFAIICFQIYRGILRVPSKYEELIILGRVLLSVLVGILAIIFTVSSITVIPYIYWSVAGLGVAYIRLISTKI